MADKNKIFRIAGLLALLAFMSVLWAEPARVYNIYGRQDGSAVMITGGIQGEKNLVCMSAWPNGR